MNIILPVMHKLGRRSRLAVFRFMTLVENTRFFTSCGDHPDGAGFTVLYRRQRLYFVLATRTQRWTTYTTKVSSNVFSTYDVSWSQQKGLSVHLNGAKVAESVKAEARGQVAIAGTTCSLAVGAREVTTSTFALMFLQVVYCHKDIADTIGIITGGGDGYGL